MKQLMLNSTIYKYKDCKTFCREFRLGKGDLIITNKNIYDNYLKYNVNEAAVIFRENYSNGESSDKMVEAMYENIKRISYERVIAIGGGSILDIAKLFALKNVLPIKALYNHKLEIIKEKELILVPTTCGTGSEVTNTSVLELTDSNAKLNLSSDELYADSAIMIPELLMQLPKEVFICSSINALINAVESYLSTKATSYTRIFSLKSIEIIISGYKKIVKEGMEVRNDILEQFLLASNYSGIAFSNTGFGVFEEMSYPICSRCKISYGKAKYILFAEILKEYEKIKPHGRIKEIKKALSNLLECDEQKVYQEMEMLLSNFVIKKALKEYGIREEELEQFVDSIIEKQEKVLINNYIKLERKQVYDIYKVLY